MSILALWADLPWLEDLGDEDDHPVAIPELLSAGAGAVWWSVTNELDDLND